MFLQNVTQHIDVPEAAVAIFFILFLWLIYHLRQADKREGYPMQASPFNPAPLQGFPVPPDPAAYDLNEGGSTVAPHNYPPAPMHARPLYRFDGTPLVPVGNPLLAGIGPGAWVRRHDHPMLTEKGEPVLQPLRLLPEWSVEAGDADPRGMAVFDWRWHQVGVVADIWIDQAIQILRLLEVELRPGLGIGRLLVPIYHASIREGAREVHIESLSAHQFADVPMPALPHVITAQEDERLNAYYAAGRFYRDSTLTDPPERHR